MKLSFSAIFASLLLVATDAASAAHGKKGTKNFFRRLLKSEAAQRALKERNLSSRQLQTIDDVGTLAVDYVATCYGGAEPCNGFTTQDLFSAILALNPGEYVATFKYPPVTSGSTVSCKLDCNIGGQVTLAAGFSSISDILTGATETLVCDGCPCEISATTSTQADFYIAAYGTETTSAISNGYMNCNGNAAGFAPWVQSFAPSVAQLFNFGGNRRLNKYIRGSK